MKPIVLGRAIASDGALATSINFDLEQLLVSRLLVQASSGGGKSWALRRLLEQTFHLVPQVVLDIDDEFHTLREKYPYVLAAAAGGDCVADPRTAQLLARRVLEHGFSLIVGIYELKKHERIRFVRLFLEALIEAPRAQWRPLLVVVDEAHLFCPEKGQGEAESAGAVIDLMTRGRKRGFCGVLATQRISKLHKDAVAEAKNKLIGGCTLDVDRKRAADELGFTTREQQISLRNMEAGEFYGFGPALTRDVTLLKVGEVETTHPQPGSRRAIAPPPPPERLKAILAKLADLPKDAAAEEGELERLRRENAEMRKAAAASRPGWNDLEAVAAAEERGRAAGAGQVLVALRDDLGPTFASLGQAEADLKGAAKRLGELMGGIDQVLRAAGKRIAKQSDQVRPIRSAAAATQPAAQRAAASPGADRSHLQPVTARLLDALAELNGMGVDTPERAQVAFLMGYGNTRSKGFMNALGAARTAGLIEYQGEGLVLTGEGVVMSRPPARPRSPSDLQERLLGLLEPVHARVLEEVIKVYPQWIARDELARVTGYENPRSKGFANAIGRLSGLGFIHYPVSGQVGARPLLFLEAR